jgi:hypothetical protein
MPLCKNENQLELNDIFLTTEEYTNLGGNERIIEKPYDNLFDDISCEADYKEWEQLDDDTKHKYIYTFIRELSNNKDSSYTFYMLKAFIFVRHTDIDIINKYHRHDFETAIGIDETTIDKKFRLYLITGLQIAMSGKASKHQTINVNPMLNSKQYYKQLIDEIFDEKELSITIKNTDKFETLGHRIAFLLFLDDMLTNNCTLLEISTSTGIDIKQVQREKQTLDKLINSIMKYTTLVTNSQ